MRIPVERAMLCLNLIVEGMSIRATERITGTHRDTICRLVVLAGERAGRLMDAMVQGVEVEDVECDEVWSFVNKKQATANRQGDTNPQHGDAWAWVAIERNSKLILTHHVGQRTAWDADRFIGRLADATAGDFQLTTDGLESYFDPVHTKLGMRGVRYAQLIKIYGRNPKEDERRYSPAQIIGTETRRRLGRPDKDRICTSIVERSNLTTRTFCKRLNRLTCAFSKKWANHKAALALHFVHYNFCRVHSSIRCTPAMAAGVASSILSIADLVLVS